MKGFVQKGGVLALMFASSLAMAEIAVIVHKDNTVQLNKSHIEDIFMGKSKTFPNGKKATPIDQPDRSKIYKAFCEQFLGRTVGQMKAHWSSMVFTGSGDQPQTRNGRSVVRYVAKKPNAIGYVDTKHVTPDVRVVMRK